VKSVLDCEAFVGVIIQRIELEIEYGPKLGCQGCAVRQS
jgi:hypothetical protein